MSQSVDVRVHVRSRTSPFRATPMMQLMQARKPADTTRQPSLEGQFDTHQHTHTHTHSYHRWLPHVSIRHGSCLPACQRVCVCVCVSCTFRRTPRVSLPADARCACCRPAYGDLRDWMDGAGQPTHPSIHPSSVPVSRYGRVYGWMCVCVYGWMDGWIGSRTHCMRVTHVDYGVCVCVCVLGGQAAFPHHSQLRPDQGGGGRLRQGHGGGTQAKEAQHLYSLHTLSLSLSVCVCVCVCRR